MQYTDLSKIFYSNKDNYNNEYNSRYNSPATIKLNININNNPAFVMIVPEILNKIYEISKLNKKLDDLYNILPNIALTQYIKLSLIDEIVLTNEIEGVISTKKIFLK